MKHGLLVVGLVGAELVDEVLVRQLLVLSLSFLVLLLQTSSAWTIQDL